MFLPYLFVVMFFITPLRAAENDFLVAVKKIVEEVKTQQLIGYYVINNKKNPFKDAIDQVGILLSSKPVISDDMDKMQEMLEYLNDESGSLCSGQVSLFDIAFSLKGGEKWFYNCVRHNSFSAQPIILASSLAHCSDAKMYLRTLFMQWTAMESLRDDEGIFYQQPESYDAIRCKEMVHKFMSCGFSPYDRFSCLLRKDESAIEVITTIDPLFHMVQLGNFFIFEQIIRYVGPARFNVNRQDGEGNTYLMYAVQAFRPHAVHFLVDHYYADILIRNNNGDKAKDFLDNGAYEHFNEKYFLLYSHLATRLDHLIAFASPATVKLAHEVNQQYDWIKSRLLTH